MRYSFPNLIAPPSGESGHFFLFDQKKCHTHVPWVWWRYVIPFKSYNYLSEIGPASYERFYAPLQTWVEISTFFR